MVGYIVLGLITGLGFAIAIRDKRLGHEQSKLSFLLLIGASWMWVMRAVDEGLATTLQVWIGGYALLGLILAGKVVWDWRHGRHPLSALQGKSEPLPPLPTGSFRAPRERVTSRELISD